MELVVAEGLQQLESHWVPRPGWEPGRTKYALHLTMEHSDEVLRIAREAAPVLAHFPALDPVPQQWLHLTMTGVGFTDEVSPEQLADVLIRVRDAWQRLDPPMLQVSGLLLARESVRVLFQHSPWLMDFVDEQRAAVDEVVGAHDWRPFHPHVSLGYANGGEADVVALRDELAALADRLGAPGQTPATFTALQLSRDEPLWHWSVLPD